MLIFDRFPSRKQAEAFAAAATAKFSLKAEVFDSQNESDKVDPFPFQLNAPIVLVQRSEPKTERAVEALVKKFKGYFAGT